MTTTTTTTDTFHGLTTGEWCRLAATRQPVDVFTKGAVIRCTLIAWRPRRPNRTTRSNVARVEYPSGSRATVKIQQVTPVVTQTAD